MNVTPSGRWAVAVGIVVVMVALFSTACSGQGVGSGGSEPIRIGGMLSFTNSGSNNGPGIEAGARARFAMANDSGGISGHLIEFFTTDDALDPAKAPAAMRTLVESDNVVATLGSGSASSAAVQPYLTQSSVLSVAGGSSSQLIQAPDSPFRLDKPTYDELAGRVVEYAVKVLGKARVAVAYTPDAIGLPTKQGVEQELKALGLTAVAEVEYSPSATNADAQAAQLKDSGADFVVVNHAPSVMAKIFNSAERIGFRPTYGSTFAGANPSLPQIMGSSLDDRIFFGTSFLLPDSADAADFRKYVEAEKGDIRDTNSMLGWTNADALVAVLRKALLDNGGKAPTPQEVLAAASNITINTPYIRNLTWTQSNRTGPDGSSIIKLGPGGQFAEVDKYRQNPFATGS